jgi:hypothetical protein
MMEVPDYRHVVQQVLLYFGLLGFLVMIDMAWVSFYMKSGRYDNDERSWIWIFLVLVAECPTFQNSARQVVFLCLTLLGACGMVRVQMFKDGRLDILLLWKYVSEVRALVACLGFLTTTAIAYYFVLFGGPPLWVAAIWVCSGLVLVLSDPSVFVYTRFTFIGFRTYYKQKDGRIDVHAGGDLKHDDPVLANYRIWTTMECRDVVVSAELWTQLMGYDVVNPLYTLDLVWNKMNIKASKFYSINQQRYDELLVGPIIEDTVRLSYALAKSRREKDAKLPFPKPTLSL